MSDIRELIKQNRANTAVQEMNKTLSKDDAHGAATPVKSELPIFGEPIQKHAQNLNEQAGAK